MNEKKFEVKNEVILSGSLKMVTYNTGDVVFDQLIAGKNFSSKKQIFLTPYEMQQLAAALLIHAKNENNEVR
jgi:hypothetical protein